MDEKRKYFRIKNNGEIHAKAANHPLNILEMSSSGAAIIKKNINLPKEGSIEIQIHSFSIIVNYAILRIVKNTMILVFKNEEEINKLFLPLKHLRDEQKSKL